MSVLIGGFILTFNRLEYMSILYVGVHCIWGFDGRAYMGIL